MLGTDYCSSFDRKLFLINLSKLSEFKYQLFHSAVSEQQEWKNVFRFGVNIFSNCVVSSFVYRIADIHGRLREQTLIFVKLITLEISRYIEILIISSCISLKIHRIEKFFE